MTEPGLVLTTYFGETARCGRHLLSDTLGDLYETHGVQAAILLRAVEGFGGKHRLHTDRFVDIALDLPLISIAIDTTAKIQSVLPEVREQLAGGLLTVERTSLLTDGPDAARGREFPHDEVKLTLVLGRRQQAGGQLAFARAVEVLHQQEASGATVLFGLDGMTHGRRARGRFFSANADVPVIVISIGGRQQIERAFELLSDELDGPLATLERVQTCKRDGILLARPTPVPATEEGVASWQKFTVFAASGARHENHPLGSELIRRLHQSGASGATLARGVWGFSGDHPPHGDRVMTIRRDTPIVATVLCPSETFEQTWPVIDDLTDDHGLVSSETVTVVHPTAV